jgi:hypothetical protein
LNFKLTPFAFSTTDAWAGVAVNTKAEMANALVAIIEVVFLTKLSIFTFRSSRMSPKWPKPLLRVGLGSCFVVKVEYLVL